MKTLVAGCILLIFMALACSPKVSKPAKADKFYDVPSNTNLGYNPATYIYENGKWTEAILQNALLYNGNGEFINLISHNIKYPAEAREHGIEGVVMSEVIVNELGVVENVSVKKGIGYGCDEVVLNAIKQAVIPGFQPAFLNGKPIRYKFFVPMSFYLTR